MAVGDCLIGSFVILVRVSKGVSRIFLVGRPQARNNSRAKVPRHCRGGSLRARRPPRLVVSRRKDLPEGLKTPLDVVIVLARENDFHMFPRCASAP